jgi:hypothetical protein
VAVRNGLVPYDYIHQADLGTTLCDDGWVYQWEERVRPWYFTLDHRGWDSSIEPTNIFRREKVDLKRIEAARWKLFSHLKKVDAKVEEAKKPLRFGKPYYIDGDHKVRLKLERGFFEGQSYSVREDKEDAPETIVEQVALFPVESDPDYTNGVRWTTTQKWSYHWYDRQGVLNRLLELVMSDVVRRVVGPSALESRFQPAIWMEINGRLYPVRSPARSNDAYSSWPSPADILIHADEIYMEPRYHQAGRAFDAPLKKPKRRKRAAR